MLRAHHVRTPGAQGWRPAGPPKSHAPLPLTADLLKALYLEVGLPMNEIATLCGVGIGAVRGGLLGSGVALRSNRQLSHRKQRRYRPT